MTGSPDTSREHPVRLLPAGASLGEGESLRFRVRLDGIERDAFALGTGGTIRAFVNACRHQSRPLDLGDGAFLEAGEIVCRHHGARYAPDTGACRGGPCAGGALTPLALGRRDGALWCIGRAPR